MQDVNETPNEIPVSIRKTLICIYAWAGGLSLLTTPISAGTGWLIAGITYSCDQYLGYPVGPSPENDLTSAPNATTCPPQLNQDSPPICFKPACDKALVEGAWVGAAVGAGVPALVLAGTGLFQLGYVLTKKAQRATAGEKLPLLVANEGGNNRLKR